MSEEADAFEANLRREQEFMMRLGEAFTEWQTVEQACYGLYASLMKGANKRLISVTFFHIQSFSSRLLLIDRCYFFELKERPAFAARWKDLRKRATNLSETRNLLAHSAYIIEGKRLVQTPVLGPSHFDATAVVRNRAMNPDYRIDADKLRQAKYKFGQLGRDLSEFRKDLSAIAK